MENQAKNPLSNAQYIIRIILLTICVKLGYVVGSILFFFKKFISADELISIFSRNDSNWYLTIAKDWYPKIHSIKELGGISGGTPETGLTYLQSPWAFFPMYPFMIRITGTLFQIQPETAAFILAIVSSLALFILTYLLVERLSKDKPLAYFSTIVVMLFPFGYHFSVFYTEAFFMVFLLLSFYVIRIGKSYRLMLSLIPLVLLRPNGLLCLLPIWIYCIEQFGLKKPNELLTKTNLKKIFYVSLFFLPALLGFAGYLYYQYTMTGFYNAFNIAQKGWGKELMFPFLSLFRQGGWQYQFWSFYIILVMLYAIFLAKKMPLSWNLFIWISILLPLSAGSTVSMSRYISIIFPLYFIFSKQLFHFRYKYLVVVIFAGLQFILFNCWLNSDIISY